MKILVTGADGQLGRELQIQGRKSEFELFHAVRTELDITAADDVAGAIDRCKPFLVINTAAYTRVDEAEAEPEAAFRVNSDGPANLARACRSAGIALIHISTDYVFSGEKNTPYTESDPVAPTGVYACSKADGEDRVRSVLPRHIILRTSWLYSVSGQNFVRTMLHLGREREVIHVVNDQFGSPTSAADLARAILKIASTIQADPDAPWGTYHYCGKGIITWYEFAEKIFSLAEPYQLFPRPVVRAISTDRYPTPARRPRYSAMDCGLIRQKFGLAARPWSESLASIIKRIIHEKRLCPGL